MPPGEDKIGPQREDLLGGLVGKRQGPGDVGYRRAIVLSRVMAEGRDLGAVGD